MAINLKPNDLDDVPTVPIRDTKAAEAAAKRDNAKSAERARTAAPSSKAPAEPAIRR